LIFNLKSCKTLTGFTDRHCGVALGRLERASDAVKVHL